MSRISMLLISAIILSCLLPALPAQAATHPILYLFWGEGCHHCEKEKTFLTELREQYPELEMRWFEVWKHPDFAKLAGLFGKAYNVKAASVPMTFLGEWTMTGFRSAETSGEKIRKQLERCSQDGCPDALEKLGPNQTALKIYTEAAGNTPQGWEYFPATVPSSQPQSAQETPVAERKMVVYYFHGDYRCASCTTIEQYAEEAVLEAFAPQIEQGALEFVSINTDLPEHRHFLQDYQLYTKSVIVSEVVDGQQTRWKNLEKIWELYVNERAFKDYVKAEIAAYF